MLVIPDFYDRVYVREFVNILLVSLGFKQICVQQVSRGSSSASTPSALRVLICPLQESLAATYGAGISNACVVDVGAVKTSVACVDEGLVISDSRYIPISIPRGGSDRSSRMLLNTGGNDITEFLYVLLERINFPYRDINLARWHDWLVMEDLKSRLCTLAEVRALIDFTGHLIKRCTAGRRGVEFVRFCRAAIWSSHGEIWSPCLR